MKRWFLVLFCNLLYCGFILLCSPIILYRAIRQGKYRNGFKQKIFGRIPRRRNVLRGRTEPHKAKIVWFHAVSVGEVKLLQPLLRLVQEQQPGWCCVISTTSKTGMDLAKQLFGQTPSRTGWTIFYCPLDFSWAVKKAFQRLQPDMLVLVEQEIWPNLIATAKQNGVKLAIVNGRFGEGGYKRYLWIRPIITPLLQQFDLIAVQNELYAGWFRRLGVSCEVIHITGSIKFDGAETGRNNPETVRLRKLAGITDNDIVFLAGSTQSPEEKFAVECYENLKNEFPQLRLIIVPRHPERFDEVATMLDDKGIRWERRSMLAEKDAQVVGERVRVLLVDTVGELGGWWGTATVAYVGGSMGKRGGQNMIEPAAYGAAVCFGPDTKNFRDIVEMMLRDDAAQVVHDQREMERFVRHCLEEPDFAEQLGRNAQELVQRQVGATQRTLTLLQDLLPDADFDNKDYFKYLGYYAHKK